MHNYSGPGRSVAFAREAMCCTSHPLAAQVALDMLSKGGNAVDAAVAGALVLGFCEPMMTGLGGDVFAMLSVPGKGGLIGLNGSGRAPAALDASRLRQEGFKAVPLESAHSVTIPGAVDAFDRLVADWGQLTLDAVLAPAIRFAEAGVPVCHRSAIDWETFGERLHGPGREHFLKDGKPYRAGEIFASAAQAEALRLIARDGRDAFYRGPIMEDIVSTLRDAGGLHTAEDFAAAAAEYVEPISTDYKGYQLWELPPNGQGATALLIANILKRLDIGRYPHGSARHIHLMAEATRLAYAARNRFIADPQKAGIDLALLLSDETADRLAASIDPDRASGEIESRIEALHRDTVYICVIDADGMAVSLIYSTFYPFGSGLASKKYGISLQNRGAGFSLTEGHPNELMGGKRPMHTLIPAFVIKPDGFTMPFGVMGGQFQATGHATVLSNLVDYGMDIQGAIDAPRSFFDLGTGLLTLEAGIPESVDEELVAMGYTISRPKIGMGGAQAIQLDSSTGVLTGGTDPRKDGVALGI
ncbi:gamma-glutamyltransferase (plasmid) [Agrobacterium leguminum]|uniref:gamma-glutamyltransferase n=1 Tax=Agrobacterium leguminum TaxID=2792015 RepID=UPI00272BAB34|nr:gamma-glutamyltransferase [Agrobacterium leguminum]WLE00774.1 gamma-glutamyltransferase [Agrobacterium leguminum]